MGLATDEKIEEIWKLFKETNKELKESSRDFDRRLKESKEDFDSWRKESNRDFDRRSKEYDKLSKETDKKIKKLADLFETQWGKLIEALVEPGALQLFRDRGIQVNYVTRRYESFKNGDKMEIDLLLMNSTEIVVIEVKTTLKVNDVRDFLEDLSQFLDFYPRFKEFRICGAVAAVNIEEEADKFAYRKGLFVLKAGKEGILQILNDMKFKPNDFGIKDS